MPFGEIGSQISTFIKWRADFRGSKIKGQTAIPPIPGRERFWTLRPRDARRQLLNAQCSAFQQRRWTPSLALPIITGVTVWKECALAFVPSGRLNRAHEG